MELLVTAFRDIEARPISWLWTNRIARGKLTMLSGDPGLGKSWVTDAIAAAVTTGGKLPDSDVSIEGNVIMMNAEDDPEDTMKPRLESLGANTDRVYSLDGYKKGNQWIPVQLPRDGHVIEAAVEQISPALIVIDPLSAFIGLSVNTWQDSQVRSALMPLALLARRYNIAILCVRHLTKGDRDQDIYRGQGSIGFTGAVRSELLMQSPERGSDLRLLRLIKTNIAVGEVPTVQCRIATDGFHWVGTGAGRSMGEAMSFLVTLLSTGERPTTEVEALAEAQHISLKTLERARKEVGVRAYKKWDNKWYLALPEEVDPDD